MKNKTKKFLSAVIVLVMLLAALPTGVFADDPESYDLWVGSIRVTSENCSNIPDVWGNNAKASYDPATKTLRLENVSEGMLYNDVSGQRCHIYSGGDLRIELIGESVIKGDYLSDVVIRCEGTLTVTDDGTLFLDEVYYGNGSWFEGEFIRADEFIMESGKLSVNIPSIDRSVNPYALYTQDSYFRGGSFVIETDSVINWALICSYGECRISGDAAVNVKSVSGEWNAHISGPIMSADVITIEGGNLNMDIEPPNSEGENYVALKCNQLSVSGGSVGIKAPNAAYGIRADSSMTVSGGRVSSEAKELGIYAESYAQYGGYVSAKGSFAPVASPNRWDIGVNVYCQNPSDGGTGEIPFNTSLHSGMTAHVILSSSMTSTPKEVMLAPRLACYVSKNGGEEEEYWWQYGAQGAAGGNKFSVPVGEKWTVRLQTNKTGWKINFSQEGYSPEAEAFLSRGYNDDLSEVTYVFEPTYLPTGYIYDGFMIVGSHSMVYNGIELSSAINAYLPLGGICFAVVPGNLTLNLNDFCILKSAGDVLWREDITITDGGGNEVVPTSMIIKFTVVFDGEIFMQQEQDTGRHAVYIKVGEACLDGEYSATLTIKDLEGNYNDAECTFKIEVAEYMCDFTGHDFIEVAEDGYLKTPAGCENPAVYYKSCKYCGLSGKTAYDLEAAAESFTPGSADTVTIDGVEFYILAAEDGKALLLAKNCVAADMAFDSESPRWDTSDIREWLNGEWLDGMPALKNIARTTEITTRENNSPNYTDFYTANDKVFLLSEADVSGTNCGEVTSDPKDYTYNGTMLTAPGGSWAATDAGGENIHWWLRSKDFGGRGAVRDVGPSGTVGMGAWAESGAVRPALWVQYNEPRPDWQKEIDNITPGSADSVTIDGVEFYVLAKDAETGGALLLTKNTVINAAFDDASNNWEESDIRAWLGEEWLGSMPALKANAIETAIKTRAAASSEDFVTTNDKVFLLSEADVFGTHNNFSGNVKPDDYTYNGILPAPGGIWMTNEEFWHLRTPGFISNYNVCVAPLSSTMSNEVTRYQDRVKAEYGIRPALWVRYEEESQPLPATFTYGDPLGHEFGDVSYSWGEENATCYARRDCTREGCEHYEDETAVATREQTADPTCEGEGEYTYTATFENGAFKQQTTTSEIDPLGHAFGDPSYSWDENNATCYARRDCTRDGCEHYEDETATATREQTTDPTCEGEGEYTYTAIFENTAFGEQTTTSGIAATDHAWGEWFVEREPTDREKGIEKRVCGNNETHFETRELDTVEYKIDTVIPEHGGVEISPKDPKSGDGVIITPKPDEGYEVDEVKVTDKDGGEIAVKKNGDGTYAFTMPESDVKIGVTYKAAPAPDAPETGDGTRAVLRLTLLALAALGVCVLISRRTRRKATR